MFEHFRLYVILHNSWSILPYANENFPVFITEETVPPLPLECIIVTHN